MRTPWSNPFYLSMALLTMGLVIWAVPNPARPILLAPVVLGALLAILRIGRSNCGPLVEQATQSTGSAEKSATSPLSFRKKR